MLCVVQKPKNMYDVQLELHCIYHSELEFEKKVFFSCILDNFRFIPRSDLDTYVIYHHACDQAFLYLRF